MSSSVVRKLQKLHLEERSCGLEDLLGLGPSQDGSLEESVFKAKATPVPQESSPFHTIATSMLIKKEKGKIADNEKYYYKSPCPEKDAEENVHKSFTKEAEDGGSSSLVQSVAQFCKTVSVDGINRKVFVGNVSYRMKDRELRECFELFGKVVRASICKDKRTRKSRGFGFVVFATREEAKRAINAPDYQLTCDGRLLKVSWAERKRKGKSNERIPRVSLEDLARSFLDEESFENENSAEDDTSIERAENSVVDKLNDDILLKIFSHLELKERIRIERVCKRWQSVSRQTWKSLTSLSFKGMFTPFQGAGGLTDRILYSILKRGCNNLQRLDLSGSPFFVTSVGVHFISKFCVSLKMLDLSNVAVNNQNLKELAINCKNLETMVLGRCRNFGEKGLWWFLKEAKNIRHLEVTDNLRVTGKSLWMLSNTCQVLILSGCVKINDSGLDNISTKAPDLISLGISNCLLVSDDGLMKICTNNKKLRKFAFCEAGNAVTSNGMMAIGQLTELEYLDLSQNLIIDDNTINHIATSCMKLRQLNLQACHGAVTGAGVKALSSLAGLEDVNISYLSEITDATLEHLAANSNLKYLTCKACSKISNQGLVSLLFFGGKSLVFVDLSGCYAIDDNILKNMQLTERDEFLQKITVNVGERRVEKFTFSGRFMELLHFLLGQGPLQDIYQGTSMTQEGANTLQEMIGNCEVLFEKRYNRSLRNDFDPTSFAPFYSSEDEEDDSYDSDDGTPFHPFSAKGYTVRSSDLEDHTLLHYPMGRDQAQDFLDADDPALLDDLEENFMFD